MAIITISRGSFSGGKMLAECVASALKYRCIDRDVVVQRAAAFGVPQEALLDALSKPPTFWERFRHARYVYLTVIQAALTEELRAGAAVYHGNAGHLLLRGVSHVLRVRIIAPPAIRIAAVQERLKLDQEAAMAHIRQMDHDRQKWTHYLYGVDWGDAALYDLVLNLENVDIAGACEIVAATAALGSFAETPESRVAMEALVLASRVRAALALAPSTSGLEVDVQAHEGAVTVRGRLAGAARPDEVELVVRNTPGVSDVRLEVSPESEG